MVARIVGRTVALTLLLGLLPACEAPAGTNSAVLSLSAFREGFVSNRNQPLAAGLSTSFRAGFPPSYFLSSADAIRIAPAFTETFPTAYVSTDVWVNFDRVWVQPLYIFVSAWDPVRPMNHALDLPWVVAVGPASGFASPYYRVTYVEVPAATAENRFRTVRDILDAGVPQHPGGTRLVSLVPTPEMAPEDSARVLLPTLRTPDRLGLPVQRRLWIPGKRNPQSRTGLDFGPDRFQIDERAGDDKDTVVEQPLFFFFGHDARGLPTPMTSVPRVGGTGPVFSRRPPLAPGNRPIYGSLWRLWSAQLPPSARLFVPRSRHAEWETRNWTGAPSPPVGELSPALDDGMPNAALDAFAYKVVLDGACLSTADELSDLTACPWLDSQAALERHLPAALSPSEVLVTCPYVAYAGQAVPVNDP
jgi:hypothetical protein